MKLLLDQGLPRSTVEQLSKIGIEAEHVGALGLAAATDTQILEFARQRQLVIVTLDADFHTLLAISEAKAPSVIRIPMEGLRGEGLAELLKSVLQLGASDAEGGAMISVTEVSVRIRRLPLR